MLHMEEKELNQLLRNEYQKGFEHGIKIMGQRLILACENGTPVELNDGKAYYIKTDMQNLRDIFEDLEADED